MARTERAERAKGPGEIRTIPSEGLVLVDFWAPWCDVCQATSLLAEDLVERYYGLLSLVQVNADEEPVLAALYRVRSLPALVLLEDGHVVDEFAGMVTRDSVCAAIEWVLDRRRRREALA